MTDGLIFDIQRFATHDGPGIRTTVFLAGCPLRCRWCHNPEALCVRAGRGGVPSDHPARRGVERGFVGRVGVDVVMDEVVRDVPYYDRSGGGVTFSGGEPFGQPDFLRALLEACRDRDLRTAVDTCGHADPGLVRSLLGLVDLFLYDLKLMDEEAHRAQTGATNRLILENLEMLDREGAEVQVRVPLVPGITSTPGNLTAIARHLLARMRYRRLSLLPYHPLAESKYERLGLNYPLKGLRAPSEEEVASARRLFEERGFEVSVGG